MMVIEYKQLVLSLLRQNGYPSLQNNVVLDIYYKSIPVCTPCATVKCYDRRFDNPTDVWSRDASPFQLSYMVDSGNSCSFYIHTLNGENFFTRNLPMQCQSIILSRGMMSGILRKTHTCFESEIKDCLGLLNFNTPKLHSLLNFSFAECTRVIPQYVKMRVDKYKINRFQPCTAGLDVKSRFGPPETERGILPVRVVNGHLTPCTSRSLILSLNDDFGPLPFVHDDEPYLYHYVEKSNVIIPLAYNPLENPIIVSS